MGQFRGVYTALVTPFQNNKVDLDAYERLCQRQLENGVSGLVPCGTTGETPTLSHSEWKELVQIAIKCADGRVPVIAGAGSNSTAQTVANVQQLKDIGADAALVVFPYYNKPNIEGLRRHVEAVCAVGLPIVLYHVPGRTGQRLDAETLEMLCRVQGVAGLKEATGDVALGLELLNRLDDTNVSLLSGDDFTFAALVAMGFDGVISVVSNPAPAMTVQWHTAAEHGAIATLRAMRKELLPVIDALFKHTNPTPCKAIMSGMGLLHNELRLPLAPVDTPNPNLWSRLR